MQKRSKQAHGMTQQGKSHTEASRKSNSQTWKQQMCCTEAKLMDLWRMRKGYRKKNKHAFITSSEAAGGAAPTSGWVVSVLGQWENTQGKKKTSASYCHQSDILPANSLFPKNPALPAGVLKTLSFHYHNHAQKLLSLADTSPSCPVCQHNSRLGITASLSMTETKAHKDRTQL